MSTIVLNDLDLNEDLDRAAMARLSGGYTYTGYSDSYGSWSFVNEWTSSGGFKQIGFVKYKVDKKHRRYSRTQYRTYNYEQLTVVIG